jgi:hypothetical protein
MLHGVYVRLSSAEIAEADDVARKRWDFHAEYRMRNGDPYNFSKDESGLAINIRGCRGERAAKLLFDPLEWNAFEASQAFRGSADFGDFIDIKTTRLDRHSLMVPVRHYKSERAYVLISAEQDPVFWFAGWAWGADFKEQTNFGGPAWTIPVESSLLRPIHTLLEAIA